jgi:hypothetical protein
LEELKDDDEEKISFRIKKSLRKDIKYLINYCVSGDSKRWETESNFVRSAVIKQIREYNYSLPKKKQKKV